MPSAPTQHDYVMVLALPARRVDDRRFKIESAFAQHLRSLKAKLGDLAVRLVIAAPELDSSADADDTLAIIDAEEGIHFLPMFPASVGHLGFLVRLPGIVARLWAATRRARFVHAGPSHPTRPFEFVAIVLATVLSRRTIYVTDIDHRQSPEMMWRSGMLSRRQYRMTRWLWNPLFHLQHRFAARWCSLVLLKSAQMVHEYGSGRQNVKNFMDVAFDEVHLVSSAALAQKASRTGSGPLRLVYFGRLVPYKGVDHMLRAVRYAVDNGVDVAFEIIGDGPAFSDLASLSAELGLTDRARFMGAMPFDERLFEILRENHVLLAAPLREDTPRSAFDAMASGLAVIAYDTYYYRDLRDAAAPVTVVPWMDVKAMGEAIIALAVDRERLRESLLAARAFAEPNTQEQWLDRRTAWTRQLVA